MKVKVTRKIEILITVLIVACSSFTSTLVFSYTPTFEGLLRNSRNQDLGANTIEIMYMLKFQEQTAATEKPVAGADNDKLLIAPTAVENKPTEIESKKPAPLPGQRNEIATWHKLYFKLIFAIENENRVRLLQAQYEEPRMHLKDVKRLSYFSNIFYNLKSNSEKSTIEQRLFNSILLSFVVNHSQTLIKLLKEIDPSLHFNKELENTEKIRLLQRYKIYLQTLEDDPEIRDVLTSPLAPESVLEKEKVQLVLQKNHYNNPGYMKLLKRNSRFFWEMSLPNIQASFANDDHRINFLNVTLDGKQHHFKFYDHMLFGGIHDLPKYIVYRNDNRSFVVQTLSVKHYNYRPNTFHKKHQKYREALLENVKKSSSEEKPFITIFKPSFIL